MMDQIFCHLCLALTMARKCHSFCSAAVTLYTFCLRQTTAVPIMDSRFIMKVSNYKYSLFSHSAFYMLGIIFILLREVRYLLINSFKPKFLFINNKFKVKYITQLNSTMDFLKNCYLISLSKETLYQKYQISSVPSCLNYFGWFRLAN